MDANTRLKLIDFGETARVATKLETNVGTHHWYANVQRRTSFYLERKGQMVTVVRMAPEVRTCESYTTKADVFSYGIVLWELCSALTPNRKPEEIAVGYRPPFAQTWLKRLPEIVQLSDQCCQFVPGKRPSFQNILNTLYDCKQLL